MRTLQLTRRSLAAFAVLLMVTAITPQLAHASDAHLVPVLIQLEEASLASYRGGIPGLEPTSPEATGLQRLDPSSAHSRRYLAHLDQRFDRFERELSSRAPRASVTARFEVVFGGLAARVPSDRIEALRGMPGVAAVTLDEPRPLLSDRGPAFVGAPTAWSSLGGPADAGEGVIVGVLDTGIWPEHASFSDPDPSGEPYPTPPAPPSGVGRKCEFGSSDPDDPTFSCNDKLIGAYRFMSTWESVEKNTGGFDSARDNDGHGTHTASTAAGNGGVDAALGGHSLATVSGTAPRAHVIAYKVCGTNSDGTGGCYVSDSVDAVEQAVLDGVDVINFSIGGGTDPYRDAVEQAFQDAYAAGVVTAAAAGNDGDANTVSHRGPWTLTVGASTHDRWFTSTVTLLGVGTTATRSLRGTSVTGGISTATPVVDAADRSNNVLCQEGVWSPGTFNGEIVACKRGHTARTSKSAAVEAAGGGGMLLYNVAGGDTGTYADVHSVPTIHLDVAEGQALLDFLGTHAAATGSFPPGSGNLVRRGDAMASFSSRGGSGQTLGISKPDLTAPGVDILAGYTPEPNHPYHPQGRGEEFAIVSGTSMASPAVAGAAALLVHLHPDWTPGQIRSALMTTATDAMTDDDGSGTTAFDRGSGRSDLSRAGDPGLTFDESAADYDLLRDRLWDANHPSLYHPAAGGTLRVQRTVRSGLSTASTWTAHVTEPSGVKLEVPTSVDVAANGTATFEIAANVRALAKGAVRHARLELIDGAGKVVAFPITLVKGTDPANRAPVAASVSVQTDVDAPVAVTLQATDADDDLLDHAVVTQPANGTLSGTAPDLTYTPDPGYAGSDSFSFQVDDGAASDTGTVSIEVIDAEAVDLTVRLSDAPDPAAVGDPLTYTATVSNGGPKAATGVVVTIDLPAEVGSPSVTSGSCTVGTSSPEVTCDIGDLAVGTAAVVEIEVTAAARASAATASADAQLDQSDPTGNTVTTTTRIAELPGAPGDVSATSGDRLASVTWDAPTDDGGSTITSYTVTSSPGGKTVTVGGSDRSATVTGLTNGTSYAFSVTATNVGGTGPGATSNAVVPAAVPGAPGDVSASPRDGQATVTWSAADPNGSSVTSYTVTSSPGGESVTVRGSDRSASVTGLTNGTSYTFAVIATNAVGTGPAATSNAVVPGGLPGAPAQVSATSGDRQASVTWDAPTDDGGSTITSYTVTSSPGGKTVTVGGSDRSATVTGLTNGTAHTFSVTATNAFGTGPASDSNPALPGVRLDGDPATTARVDHGDPISAAVEMSRSRFGHEDADHVVLSRSDTFPDALAGAALTHTGPLLLTPTDTLASATRVEVDRVLPQGGTVYILGGPEAVSSGVEETLRGSGYDVVRLSGRTRVETALAVADQVRRFHPDEDRVALARAFGPPNDPSATWADSVTGGAWAADAGVPIVLSHTDHLSEPTARWLSAAAPARTVILGGPHALSEAVERAVPSPVRVAGEARDSTAVAIARDLWRAPLTGRRDFLIVDGYGADGWAYGLAAAGLASQLNAPLLVVHPDLVPPATDAAVAHCGSPVVDLLLIGSTRVISEVVADRLEQLDGDAC